MSVTYIPENIKFRLWGLAAGRCEYEGCNKPLWRDQLTKAEFNTAYMAHIVADSPDGPRGDPILSEQLKQDISNLALMCDEHHRLIDKHDVASHPVARLREMKRKHERRVELAAGIAPEKKSEILLYGANIGVHHAPLSYEKAARAMFPSRYPAESRAIELGLQNSAAEDRSAAYWALEAAQLRAQFARQVVPRLSNGGVEHLSVFALAPQPLLTLLGFLLPDIPAAEIYQLRREPPGWSWQDQPDSDDVEFALVEPARDGSNVALVLSLSATVVDSRVERILGPECSIWRIEIPQPNNDFLRNPRELARFRRCGRFALDTIKSRHPDAKVLHVFPAVPVAIAVELGRVIMPKADMTIRMYDENKALGGFVHALDINEAEATND